MRYWIRMRPKYLTEFANTYPEVHSFVIGLYCGFKDFRDWDGLDQHLRENKDVRKEPHYAHGGYILGAILRVSVYLLVGFSASFLF